MKAVAGLIILAVWFAVSMAVSFCLGYFSETVWIYHQIDIDYGSTVITYMITNFLVFGIRSEFKKARETERVK